MLGQKEGKNMGYQYNKREKQARRKRYKIRLKDRAREAAAKK
jgi:hypothetical protein